MDDEYFFLDIMAAEKKFKEVYSKLKSKENRRVELSSIPFDEFFYENSDVIIENKAGHINNIEPALMAAIDEKIKKDSEDDENLSQEAIYLRDNWESFWDDGIEKALIGIGAMQDRARLGQWEDALERFRWIQKKMCIASSIIEFTGEEEES